MRATISEPEVYRCGKVQTVCCFKRVASFQTLVLHISRSQRMRETEAMRGQHLVQVSKKDSEITNAFQNMLASILSNAFHNACKHIFHPLTDVTFVKSSSSFAGSSMCSRSVYTCVCEI